MSKWIDSTLLLVAAFLYAADSAEAQLTFYYDPDTGNVAFDSTLARFGGTYSYVLSLQSLVTDIEFRHEESVLPFNSSFASTSDHRIGESSLTTFFSGYYTIGNVLPTGLADAEWGELFSAFSLGESYPRDAEGNFFPGYHSYRDCVSCPNGPPAEFVYGQPDREFDNRWDLVDPDELDWAESATLVYDPLTGNVTIDTARGEEGGHISLFILESEGGFLPDNFTPWIDAPFTTATSDVIGFAADAVEPGVYSAGAILDSGLTLEEVQSTFTSARFVGRAGYGGGSFDFETEGVDFAFAMLSTLPGDFNQDGAVDLLDLDILGSNFGGPGTSRTGDANGDGWVDLLDLDELGRVIVPGPGLAIPEPTAIAMIAFALAGFSVARPRCGTRTQDSDKAPQP